MSKVEEAIKNIKDKRDGVTLGPWKDAYKEGFESAANLACGYLKEIRAEQEELQKKADKYDSFEACLTAMKEKLRPFLADWEGLAKPASMTEKMDKLLKELDDPEKFDQFIEDYHAFVDKDKPVEIPAYVAKWIEEYKKKDLNFYTSVSSMTTGDVGEWYVDNEDFYAKAWYFGYTVKQEQLYYMPVLYQKNKTLYYCFDRNGEITFGQGNLKSDKYKFTKEQIEQHFTDIADKAIEVKEEQG
ncbi:DUF1642 domain-containing protein [uncultured Enterococcus sp.]|uniref:DUF1642 domain-containing protein n=1 Tax=uncultured Enterococcus sp. TaxID=167972 RepID=UPI002AA8B9F5|nr:DUF1642 domain-containing protein [uncultured Enterococcus sp.]